MSTTQALNVYIHQLASKTPTPGGGSAAAIAAALANASGSMAAVYSIKQQIKKDKKNQQRELENEESSKQSLFSKFLDSNLVTYTYSIIIVVSIFGDDLRRISIMKKYDYFMDIPLLLILTLFVCEITYNGIIRKSAYILSIDILLDVLATLSILFDVAFFFEGFLAPYEK